MKLPRIKFFIGLIAISLLLDFGYYYREDATRLLRGALNRLQPCREPITYSIASLDARFGLTETELLALIQRVEQIWEAPLGRPLFEPSAQGDLKINLVYDDRQRATDALRKLGISINNDQSTYKAVKARYDSLKASYEQEKARLDAQVKTYQADQAVFEKDVAYWNQRGGASPAEYEALRQRGINLNDQAAAINQAEKSFNGLVDTVNATAAILNKLVAELNLQGNAYDQVSAAAGPEFKEGEYISDAAGQTINIFQFDNRDKLVRVIAHELGHALGLDHLDNPKAIMYYLNEGINEKLTADDLAALKKMCRIE